MTSYESDSDGSASPIRTYQRGFIALIVKGKNAVKQFEEAYPTHFQRCLLAKTIDRNSSSAVRNAQINLPYEVDLRQYPDWRIGSGFQDFVDHIVPEALRADQGVYNLSDWDSYDYWSLTTATSTPVHSPLSPRPRKSPEEQHYRLDRACSTVSSPMKALKCSATASPAATSAASKMAQEVDAVPTDAPSTPRRSAASTGRKRTAPKTA